MTDGDKGRRGRMGGVPRGISIKAEKFQKTMEPPYDSDDIITAYESGFMDAIRHASFLFDRMKELMESPFIF